MPEYPENQPSHAGGVVIRRQGGSIRYLLVTARDKPDEWVLPKGHIEPDESAEQTATREVLEESGIEAIIVDALEMIEFNTAGEQVRAQFFLMEAVSEGQAGEDRRRSWYGYEEAMEMLGFPQARLLIHQAHLLSKSRGHS
ncbi:MAG: NUDIX hydrolase [Thermodesulfobacteriota bacterium]